MIVGRRRGGMTARELHAYMTDVHGPMVVDYIERQPGAAPQCYVQNHVFDCAYRARAERHDPFALNRDFVTQVWFDNPARAEASLTTQFYLEKLRPDEARFVEQASVVQMPVLEHELLAAGSTAYSSKTFVFLKRAPSVPRDGFLAACQRVTQALRDGSTVSASGIGRWLHNECVQRPGRDAPVDAIEEIWLASDAAARGLGAQLVTLFETEMADLIEPGSTCLLLAHEHVLFAGTPERHR